MQGETLALPHAHAAAQLAAREAADAASTAATPEPPASSDDANALNNSRVGSAGTGANARQQAPQMSVSAGAPLYQAVMRACWAANPSQRPTSAVLASVLRAVTKECASGGSLVGGAGMREWERRVVAAGEPVNTSGE
eukprot:COSAG05_NODE_311_length_11636_cov_11.922250_14_plen_138_part_00